MSASDLLRAKGSRGVLIFLLLPGSFALIPIVAAVVLAILVFQHRLALAEAIAPAVGVLLVLEVARHVFTEFTGHRPASLTATDATVIEAIGECRRVTLGDQLFMSRLATRAQQQHPKHTYTTPHFRLPAFRRPIQRSLEVDSSDVCERAVINPLASPPGGHVRTAPVR